MTFCEEDLERGKECLTLGPAYFDARRVAERVMASFEAEQFKPLIDKMAADFNDRLWNDVQSSLLVDTECNLQGEIYRAVDACVQALLGGHKWALQKYVLGQRYECDEIRKAVAAHIPTDLQDARIEDLEKENARLKEDLLYANRR